MGGRLLDVHSMTIKLVQRTLLVIAILNRRRVYLVMVVNSAWTSLVLGGVHFVYTLDFEIIVDVRTDYV